MTRATRWTSLGALISALLLGGCLPKAPGSGATDPHAGAANGVRLAPDPAYAASRIEVVFDDPWVDVAKCSFEWRRDGSRLAEAHGPVLDPSSFRKGDRIAVRVQMPDSAGGAPRELGAEVRVINTPPRVASASLRMSAPAGTAIVEAVVEAADQDADSVTVEYRWFRNESPLHGVRGPALTSADFSHGDRLAVEVVASDGESESPPLRSAVLAIENLPPRITSEPRALRPGDGEFRYQLVVADPDRDPLRFELVAAPPGMTVEPQGLIVWPLPPKPERQGDHRVSVRVSDMKGGEATQEFSLHFD